MTGRFLFFSFKKTQLNMSCWSLSSTRLLHNCFKNWWIDYLAFCSWFFTNLHSSNSSKQLTVYFATPKKLTGHATIDQRVSRCWWLIAICFFSCKKKSETYFRVIEFGTNFCFPGAGITDLPQCSHTHSLHVRSYPATSKSANKH